MNYLTQIQKAVDYIELNIEENLSLMDVAAKSGISFWYFQKVFRALTGEPLKTYIRNRRLTLAAKQLLESETKILDLSFASGFESQESFTRAFKKLYEITPAQFRKQNKKSLFLPKLQIDESYLIHLNKGVIMNPEIIEFKGATVAGLMTHFKGVASEGHNAMEVLPPLWQKFMTSEIAKLASMSKGTECYGVIDFDYKTEAQSKSDENLLYYCGQSITSDHSLPTGFESVYLPEGRYAKFKHTGAVSDFGKTINYIYSTWLPQSNYERADGPEFELYDESFKPADEKNSICYYFIPLK